MLVSLLHVHCDVRPLRIPARDVREVHAVNRRAAPHLLPDRSRSIASLNSIGHARVVVVAENQPPSPWREGSHVVTAL